MAVKKGDQIKCDVCGVVCVVDELCGCAECDIVCCGQPMKNIGPKKVAAKKKAKPVKKKTAKKKK